MTVVKVGGNEVEDAAWVGALAARLANVQPLVVVHGGGREVTTLQARFGVEAQWHEGLRVSTPETVRIAAMVLSGVVNKRLVAALLSAGVDAIGISGEDGALIVAEPALGGALGRTGVVAEVRAEMLCSLRAAGLTPVVSPVSRGRDGAPFNVNADDAAAAIAVAIGAGRLLFVSNVEGVQAHGSRLERLSARHVEDAVSTGILTGGMAPKARAAAYASSHGVEDVRIGGLDLLTGGAGTRIVTSMEVSA